MEAEKALERITPEEAGITWSTICNTKVNAH
jgi:hypothetical protein